MGDKDRLAEWARKKIDLKEMRAVKSVLRRHGLNTVCESAKCPNQTECFGRGVATFMIMGDICTRNCRFCAVENGVPLPLDRDEPMRVSAAARALALDHVVVTSVTRDDLDDYGAEHFADTVQLLKAVECVRTIEVLTSDLGGKLDALEKIIGSEPDVFNHNVETIPDLYPEIRPQAHYERSLVILKRASCSGTSMKIKSGFMVGFGERIEEVKALLDDLRNAECSVVTIGQYLRPSRKNIPVEEYVPLEKFSMYEDYGKSIGMNVIASPFVRSSYRADAFLHGMHDESVPAGKRSADHHTH